MGNVKSKKTTRKAQEPDKFFDRERWKEQKRELKKKRNANPMNKRLAVKEPPPIVAGTMAIANHSLTPPPGPAPAPPPANVRSYDDEAIDTMRYQLQKDADAFLLNNILLSVQFFENYERESHHIKNNPISDREHSINEAMVRLHKHVFFADRLQECVNEHVSYQKERGLIEPLSTPRLFVIYDNVEASEPGDTSDYSAVLDAPFYKLCIEDCKEPGFVKLKKLEVLESTLMKDNEDINTGNISDDSVYADSEKESNDSDDVTYATKGNALLQQIESKLKETKENEGAYIKNRNMKVNSDIVISGRRPSGPTKHLSLQVAKSNINNINSIRQNNVSQLAEQSDSEINANDNEKKNGFKQNEVKPRKSILKPTKRISMSISENRNNAQPYDIRKDSENMIGEETETSGYRSNSSSRHNEFSETESDYGYSTITEATTPKKIELSEQSNYSQSSGVLPDECWTTVEINAVDNWSDDEDEQIDDTASKILLSRNLYETHYYLSSVGFMKNFVDNFIINLGMGLGLTQDSIGNALTQGASIYCNRSDRNGTRVGYEIFPGLLAAWPNAANQWIIRERKIIQNPRTNFSYQHPTRYMVNKAIGFGCLLLPIGFRPKRGLNPEQRLQWKVIFPAAERYLESCLAHSHMRVYLFTLALQKTFLENETSKIGMDATHIKNHLFWQCEDNFARWPEDRLGETFRLFIQNLYVHFGQGRFPNYFIENCNDFKSIPKPLLMKLQRKLADIRESPVTHILKALDKLKYMKKDFYPRFNSRRLYDILTCKNPLRIINPHLPLSVSNQNDSSDSDNDQDINFWDKAKARDKHYQWKKEKQRQMQEKRKANSQVKRKKSVAVEVEINEKIILPQKMESERRRLVLEFFIPHFIAMARSSERFDAIRQAVIYLEQAHRLCILLSEEPSAEITSKEYLHVIRDKLTDCHRKLANQGGYKLPLRRESNLDRNAQKPIVKQRPRYENIINFHQDSPTDSHGIAPFTFVDVHAEASTSQESKL